VNTKLFDDWHLGAPKTARFVFSKSLHLLILRNLSRLENRESSIGIFCEWKPGGLRSLLSSSPPSNPYFFLSYHTLLLLPKWLIVGTSAENGISVAVTSSGVLLHVHSMACGTGVLGSFEEGVWCWWVDICDMDENVGAEYDTSGSGGGVFTWRWWDVWINRDSETRSRKRYPTTSSRTKIWLNVLS